MSDSRCCIAVRLSGEPSIQVSPVGQVPALSAIPGQIDDWYDTNGSSHYRWVNRLVLTDEIRATEIGQCEWSDQLVSMYSAKECDYWAWSSSMNYGYRDWPRLAYLYIN